MIRRIENAITVTDANGAQSSQAAYDVTNATPEELAALLDGAPKSLPLHASPEELTADDYDSYYSDPKDDEENEWPEEPEYDTCEADAPCALCGYCRDFGSC